MEPLARSHNYGLPENYFNSFAEKAMSVTPGSANETAKKFILPII
jgi:hypothetical protein